MRFLILVAGLMLAGVPTTAQAERGIPSQARLAEMGLSGMEILSDQQAESIRVYGSAPNRWGNLYPFVKGVSRLQPQLRYSSLGQRVLIW